MIRVCVFPAQNEGAVEINYALSYCESIETYGATSIRGHNEYNFRNYIFDLPPMESEEFLSAFDNLLKEHQIDLIFPTSDSAVAYFAEHQARLSAKCVNADFKSAVICNNKRKTYELFQDCGFCPKLLPDADEFPCFVKPVEGEGAVGAKLIRTPEDLPKDFTLEHYVTMEYLEGDECTVDCLTDCNGALRAVLPRTRTKVFHGMTVYGECVEATPEINEIASVINARLVMRGLWYFQIKRDGRGQYKLLEISMRCAGTMCQTRNRGYNLPLLSVYTALGHEIDFVDNHYSVIIDRTLFARYAHDIEYDNVYIDYDGTVIVKDEVCLSVIRFLYQCKNKGKKIILVTRHNVDHNDTVFEDMARHGISEKLFDEILLLTLDEEKYSVIRNPCSIFIDNSYFERKKVHDQSGIPVFSVDGVDVLQDWRL